MYRTAIEELKLWKDKQNRKPLILRGARQVGKTWLMKEFAKQEYKQSIYINFDKSTQLKALFSKTKEVQQIIQGLELYTGKKIDSKTTLIIFDEIQEEPQALASLKYFYEDMPEYHIICAGSLLGVALHEGTSFPVGKVEFLDLYPLNFHEFLISLNKGQYVELMQKKNYELANTFHEEFKTYLKQYFYIGGMPEVVASFLEHHDFNEARNVQQQILDAYEQDFSKHAPHAIVPRIRMLWNSIPAQLAKENKKFIYGLIKEGARAKDYELALLWLCDCGLVHKVHRISKPNLPIKSYDDPKAFKLYILDIGLLGCMVNLQQSVLLEKSDIFTEFKGALSEQYVLQQLKTIKNLDIAYWTNQKGMAEIDFIVSDGANIIPLEVKAEINVKAKSLKQYRELYAPAISVRSSLKGYRWEEGLCNLPLWAILNLPYELDSNN